jgi:tetratricopeptide (TPR) repeat protein
MRLGEYEAAETTLAESVQLFQAVEDKQGIADALNIMALAVGMNEYDRSLEIHERCLAIRREIGDRWGIVASLQTMATLKVNQGRFRDAQTLCREALALQGGAGGDDSRAAILYALGAATAGLGEYAAGQAILQECVTLCRAIQNPRLMGWALHELAAVAYTQGAYAESERLNTESLALFVAQGARPGIAHAHARLGRDAHRAGRYHEAGRLYRQALDEALAIPLQPVLGQALAGLAGVAAALDPARETALLFGCAHAVLAQIASSVEREGLTLNRDAGRAALGDMAWEAACIAGQALTPAQAATLAQQFL